MRNMRNVLVASMLGLLAHAELATGDLGQSIDLGHALVRQPSVAARLALFERWVGLQMAHEHQPGVAAAIVHGGETVWLEGFGVRDLARVLPTVQALFTPRFVSALMHGTSTSILSVDTRREMQRVHWLASSWTAGRGLGFSIRRHEGRTLVGHGGWVAGYRSQFAFDPETGFGAVVLTNTDEAGPSAYLNQLFDFVIPSMEKAVQPSSPEALRLSPADLAQYQGTYQNPWGEVQDVRVLDGGLVLYDPGYPPRSDLASRITPLRPVAEDTFQTGTTDERGTTIRFEVGLDRRVKRIKVGENYLFPVGCGSIDEDLQCRP